MAFQFAKCQILPLPDHQTSFLIEGVERTRWHFGPNYPRPFFYPLVGPSGTSLTRMGHPGASNHDHHRSVWFAHHKVLGIDFWSDNTEAKIRQTQWLAYEDGDNEAVMAVELGWYDGHDPRALMKQQLVAAVSPGSDSEWFLELQSTFTPMSETLELEKTNFGFLAVRVAKHISEYFGGGKLTNSEGRTSEAAIFGRKAEWMDYSGPAPNGDFEGITYCAHPSNLRYPSRWHVREDGWMGASPCMDESFVVTKKEPLVLRYLLHVHKGKVEPNRATATAKSFHDSASFQVAKTSAKHLHLTVERTKQS